MIEIPKQLQNPEFRFIKVRANDKIPIEKDWQATHNYKFDDDQLLTHINERGNYGVVCGYGNLIVIDADTSQLIEKIEQSALPKTFTIKTGSGGRHYYFIVTGESQTLVLNDEGKNIGHVQFKGRQVVGPSSTHPNGNIYVIEKDLEIAQISWEEVQKVFWEEFEVKEDTTYSHDSKIELKLEQVLNPEEIGLHREGERWQGPNPYDPEPKGRELSVNFNKQVWHCFSHNSGGDVWLWLAVKERIIKCEEAQADALRGDRFKQLLKIAEEKYNYKTSKTLEEKAKSCVTKGEAGSFLDKQQAADLLCKEFHFFYTKETYDLYFYNENTGVWQRNGDQEARKFMDSLWHGLLSSKIVSEVLTLMQIQSIKEIDIIKSAITTTNEDTFYNLNNGVLKLSTLELMPHNPQYYFTGKMPITFNPEARPKEIIRFVTQICGDNWHKAFLIFEHMAYPLVLSYNIQKGMLYVGDGANGKSTLINLLKHFYGKKNCASLTLQQLSERFMRAELFNKLCNMGADIPPVQLIDTGVFKAITGGDSITVEFKNKPPFLMDSIAKQYFSCNKIPETTDKTKAFWRRWSIVLFNQIFQGENDDPQVLNKLTNEKEMSGLLNFLLAFVPILKNKTNFTFDMSEDEVARIYTLKSNSAQSFINEMVVEDVKGTADKQELTKAYMKYCDDNNLIQETDKKFWTTLKDGGIKMDEYRGQADGIRYRGLKGIRLKTEEELKQMNLEGEAEQRELKTMKHDRVSVLQEYTTINEIEAGQDGQDVHHFSIISGLGNENLILESKRSN